MLSLATVNASANFSCSELFGKSDSRLSTEDSIKLSILTRAISQSKIKPPSDQKVIDKVLKNWDLDNSSPTKIEKIAQSIVFKSETKKTFSQWLKDIITRGYALRDATRVRAETLVLKRQILEGLAIRGYAHKNSILDNYRQFRADHFNQIQLAKFLTVNAVLIHYFGIPLYFPNFDLVKNLDLTTNEIDLVESKGFDEAYKTILTNHRLKTIPQRIIDQAPRTFFLGISTVIAYNYFNSKVEESHYEITSENSIPQSNVIFLEWQKSYLEENGRLPNLKNGQDRKEWDSMVLSIYRAWADSFNEREGRYPDLSKERDRLSWEKFLASVQP